MSDAPRLSNQNSLSRGLDGLSEGQLATLALVAQYKSSKEIARILGISPHTVDQRLKRVQALMGVNSRFEAARIYTQSSHAVLPQDAALWESLVYQPSGLSQPVPAGDEETSPGEMNRSGGGSAMLNQSQAAYNQGFVGWNDRKPWYAVLLEGNRTNDLTPLSRAICIGALTLTSLLALGAAVALVEGMSRIF